MAPGGPNLMIFGPIACFRRSGSRFSGQKGPRSSEMRVYIEITGHIKNHQNFKILFWSRESKKTIFTIFPEFFTKKWAGNLGISSETTWESRVRRPGRQPATSLRSNEFSVLRISTKGPAQHLAYGG